MKKLLVCLILLMAVQVWAQDKTKVTVKSTEKNNGVVIVTINISDAKKSVDLNCNDGTPSCAAPKAGEYWMVKLPKNHGVYDCQCVDLFPVTADPDSDPKLGEYCMP
ncbi:hypothetical protein Acid345_0960 [Candidatus Koribacter versatilis Ellin345]|uniref:Uncharacterized protein n=1 Tax=Koribacter versatilis (strain Ellin345) TaxID=204669 RepID=Q1IT37_KORVE|nr:hypothetical protein [Candidatus Koribacter versatilis]ABF39963.1 hypothetical protein Acid345_0960 [Candidatus Koribacter versatilis Ellin345]